jgi:hypothetical protein
MVYLLKQGRLSRSILASIFILFLLLGCSDGNNNSTTEILKPQPPNPVVEEVTVIGGESTCCTIFGGAIDLRDQNYIPGTPFYSGLALDAAEVGYRETEYFISGTANSYVSTEELGQDGVWSVQQADAAEYRTRIVVRRPIDPEKFNGTVVAEWFNVSGGLDAAPDFLAMHTEFEREGYVWVGVSAQSVGVEGGGGAFDISLKIVDPVRYGSLHHPGDSFSYSIFSQAAQAVLRPQGIDPLEGLNVERILAVGQSQSAFRLVTYFNAVNPTIDLFDGFVIHSRGGSASGLSQEPQAEVSAPAVAFIRTDTADPVITLQSETDVFQLNSVASRQSDSLNFRIWEVSGSSHSDLYTTLKAPLDTGVTPEIADIISEAEVRPPFITCSIAANDGPMHFVAKAAVHALDRWVRDGEPAPSAPFLSINEAKNSFIYDAVGNSEGGVRSPHVDAPVAILHGEGQPRGDSFCNLFGTTELFDSAQMAALYPDKQAYIDAIDAASQRAVSRGVLRPRDAELIKARARTSPAAVPVP